MMVKVMLDGIVLCSCLLLSACCVLFSVARAHSCLDISPNIEITFDFDAEWIASFHKVFENHVNDVFVKDLHVAKRIDVKLQTLQFDATLVRCVLQTNGSKVGKIREGTNAGELGNLELDLDLATGKLVGEGIERIEIHLFARC